jgi:hypothetical protein
MGLPLHLLFEDGLAECERGDCHGEDRNAVSHGMQPFVQPQSTPGLNPLPELEPGERDEGHAAADQQQTEQHMPQGEELGQPFHA